MVDDQPAPAGDVTWSMAADPSQNPLHPHLGANQILDGDVWTDGRRRRIREGRKWKLSEAQTIGLRYARHFDLVIPGSSPFDVTAEVPADLVAEHRAAYLHYHRTQERLGLIWQARGGDARVVTPLPLKGGVTFMGERPSNPLVGDRWIQGDDRHGPALVWTANDTWEAEGGA